MSSTCLEQGQTVPVEEAASSGLSPRPTARPASLSTATVFGGNRKTRFTQRPCSPCTAYGAPFFLRIFTPRRSRHPRTAPTPTPMCLAMALRDVPEAYIASASSP